MAQYAQSLLLNGLNNISVTVPSAGQYFTNGKISLPTQSTGASINSQAVMTIKQNGSTIYTGTAGASGFGIPGSQLTCAAGDVLNYAFTSSTSVDQPLNAIKSTINLGQGL